MNRKQLGIILPLAIIFILSAVSFFICNTVPPEKRVQGKKEAFLDEGAFLVLRQNAVSELKTQDKIELGHLREELNTADQIQDSLETLEKLASLWYRAGEPAISGYLATEIADKKENGEAWNIAGTTFMACARMSESELEKNFCITGAKSAFENAVTTAPENPSYRINLAVANAEYPPTEEPMRGVLMLLDLVEKHPEEPGVYYQLGRFGYQTGQTKKAVERLKKAVELDPAHTPSHCLLHTIYAEMENIKQAQYHEELCNLDNN